jgi:uncharacterized protein (DUF58 family)
MTGVADAIAGLPRRRRRTARPGPGPTPETLLRALDLTVGRRIRGLVPGEYRAHDLGGGTELAQVRPYEPGDDVRRIDWNVTARTSVPHIRVHVPERALTTWLVLDVSASMTFGTADRRKADVAEGVAVAVGHLATQRGNRLGTVTFGAGDDRRLPPAAGRRGLLAVLLALREQEAAAAAGDRNAVPAQAAGAVTPAGGLGFVNAVAARGGLVVLVSDFRGPRDWLPALGATAARHQVLAVEIRDRHEDALPDVGELTLVDGETGREVRVDTSSRDLRERFARAAAEERASLATAFRRLGVDHVVLGTGGSWLVALAARLRLIRAGRAS